MALPDTPNSRKEKYLAAIAGQAVSLPEFPITREEAYLDKIAKNGGGGGGGGVSSYTALTNKPKINNVELTGNKTSAQLGLEGTLQYDDEPTANSNRVVKSRGIYSALAEKVDKIAGKGLSTADFTVEEKTKLGTVESGAQVNIIERITLNGVQINPINKAVPLSVITRTVENLQNYYLKTETYTRTEVNDLINNISSLTLDIVEVLPTTDISTTKIYLVETSTASNVYMQYAYINGAWAQLGTTQVDLTNYYTKAQVDNTLEQKQDKLDLDETPMDGSDNPVKSGGVKTALDGKQDALTFDIIPTENSSNPVTSGGLYSALSEKQNTLVYDEEPTDGSSNMLTSGAVANALSNVSVGVATLADVGVVKPDGETITVDNDGTLHGSSGLVPNEEDFDFTEGVLSLQTTRRMWTGTGQEWEDLSTAEKQQYSVANITDDEMATTVSYAPEYTLGAGISLVQVDEDGNEEDLEKPLEIRRYGQCVYIGGSFRLTQDFSARTGYVYVLSNLDLGNIHKFVGGTVPLRGYVYGGEDVRPWLYSGPNGSVGLGLSPNENLVEDAIIFVGGVGLIDY